MLELSDKVISRDGLMKGRVICVDAQGKYPVVVLVESDKTNFMFSRCTDGSQYESKVSSRDFILEPVITIQYKRLFNDGSIGSFSQTMVPVIDPWLAKKLQGWLEFTWLGEKLDSVRLIPYTAS